MEDITTKEPKLYIQIETSTEEEKLRIGNKIHNQLVGNKDYIDCNIVLNIDEPYTVRLWIYDDCVNPIPEIRI